MANVKQLKEMLAELLKVEDGFNDWELKFIESLSHQDYDFTTAQAMKLEQIWYKRLGLASTHS